LSLTIHEASSPTSQGTIGPSRPKVFSRTYHYIVVKSIGAVESIGAIGSTIVGIITGRNMATKSVVTKNDTTNK